MSKIQFDIEDDNKPRQSSRKGYSGSRFTSTLSIAAKSTTSIDPKFLQKIIQTINRRSSVAEVFHKSMIDTAIETRKKHSSIKWQKTRQQKIVEGIAVNLGLAKVPKPTLADDAKRLVNMLLDGLARPTFDEEEEDIVSESELATESDIDIASIVDPDLEMTPKKKHSSRKPKERPKVHRQEKLSQRRRSESLSKHSFKKTTTASKIINLPFLKVSTAKIYKDKATSIATDDLIRKIFGDREYQIAEPKVKTKGELRIQTEIQKISPVASIKLSSPTSPKKDDPMGRVGLIRLEERGVERKLIDLSKLEKLYGSGTGVKELKLETKREIEPSEVSPIIKVEMKVDYKYEKRMERRDMPIPTPESQIVSKRAESEKELKTFEEESETRIIEDSKSTFPKNELKLSDMKIDVKPWNMQTRRTSSETKGSIKSAEKEYYKTARVRGSSSELKSIITFEQMKDFKATESKGSQKKYPSTKLNLKPPIMGRSLGNEIEYRRRPSPKPTGWSTEIKDKAELGKMELGQKVLELEKLSKTGIKLLKMKWDFESSKSKRKFRFDDKKKKLLSKYGSVMRSSSAQKRSKTLEMSEEFFSAALKGIGREWEEQKKKIIELSQSFTSIDESTPSDDKELPAQILVEVTEKVKKGIIRQVEKMLNALAFDPTTAVDKEENVINEAERERKGVEILWKNYMDILNEEDQVTKSLTEKKEQRISLLNEVDIDLNRGSACGFLPDPFKSIGMKTKVGLKEFKFLKEKAKEFRLYRDELKEKALKEEIDILEEQLLKSTPPREVLLEEKRRQALIESAQKKISEKKTGIGETTMEEIFQMRGFRGRVKNRGNVIWIRPPEFMGFLESLKREESRFEMAKRIYGKYDTRRKVTKKSKGERPFKGKLLVQEPYNPKVTVSRKPADVYEPTISRPQSKFLHKHPKPFNKANQGYMKYYGFLES